jgi:hypothetical protein
MIKYKNVNENHARHQDHFRGIVPFEFYTVRKHFIIVGRRVTSDQLFFTNAYKSKIVRSKIS